MTTVLLLHGLAFLAAVQEADCDASRVWSAMMERRGGMAAVESLVVRMRGVRRNGRPRPEVAGLQVLGKELKLWHWSGPNPRDRRFPAVVSLTDLEAGTFRAKFGGSYSSDGATNPEAEGFWVHLLGLVPGSRWGPVEPSHCKETNGDFDVTVRWRSYNLRYVVDRSTLLAKEVHAHSTRSKMEGSSIGWSLGDYRLVSGILLPHRQQLRARHFASPVYALEYEMNVPISPGLFAEELSVEKGPDQWRGK